MSKRTIKSIRAVWQDAREDRARRDAIVDPQPGDESGWGYKAAQWPGAPADAMPPKCPVIPLGRDGETYYFMDSMRQLNGVHRRDWSKKILIDLFNARPNYLTHHWPRFAEPNAKKGIPAGYINGLEADEAIACLVHACANAGAIEIGTRVRGRGAWATKTGQLVWHAGDAIYTVDGKKLVAAQPAAIDGTVYPGAPEIMTPWREPVEPEESPAHQILTMLRTWSWERQELDPILIVGWIACAFLGGALDWRPYLFFSGGAGVGKSVLQKLIRAVMGDALIKASNATEASLRQFGRQDTLPIFLDEFESRADNRKTIAIIELARIAASGDDILRGGADHQGQKFQMRSCFAFSAINPPPMTPADKSRMIPLNLSKLDKSRSGDEPVIRGDMDGRMILRCLMDQWPQWQPTLDKWRKALRIADLSDRAQMTYGTLLAGAELLLGYDAMKAAGLPLDEDATLGGIVKDMTELERAEQSDNWSDCIERMMAATIDAWRDGVRPTVGGVVEQWEAPDGLSVHQANDRLKLVGLSAQMRTIVIDGQPSDRFMLAVPIPVALGPEKIFRDTIWADGVWTSALKQAPHHVVRRDLGSKQNVKINRVTARCLLIDLKAYDEHMKGERG